MVDEATLPLALQTLATLTELLQGPCAENQNFMVSQNVGDLVSKIFVNHYYDISADETWEMRMGAVTMLLSLMEGHMNVPMITTLMQSLDMEPLVKSMDATYLEWAEERGLRGSWNPIDVVVDFAKEIFRGLFLGLSEGNEYEDHLNLACNIFIFMKTVLDLETLITIEQQAAGVQRAEMMVDKTSRGIKELFRGSKTYRFLSQKIATIEIKREGRLEKVCFRVPSICVYNLRKESKEALINDVARGGDGARLRDFFERSYGLIREMEYYERMRQTRGLSLIHKYDPIFDNLSLLVAFSLNLQLLFSVNYRATGSDGTQIDGSEAYEGYAAVGMLQIVLQCLLFLNFFFGPTLIYLEQMWTQVEELMNRAAVEDSKQTLGIEAPNVDKDPTAKIPFPFRVVMSLFMLLLFPAFYKRAIFLSVSFLGYYMSPIWYSLQMLQIAFKFQELQNVIKSISSNGFALLLTTLLTLAMMFIFAFIAYSNFSGDFGRAADNMGEGGNCDTLLRCMLMIMNNCLRANGGAGDVLAVPHPQDNYNLKRTFWDLGDFMCFNIIALKLVFGIILDTFGVLREQRDFVTHDQESKCFICGLEPSEFDRVPGDDFKKHIERDHDMWNYVFFMVHCKYKDPQEHTGLEGFVHACTEKHEPSFYPIGGAMSVESLNRGDASLLASEAARAGAPIAAETTAVGRSDPLLLLGQDSESKDRNLATASGDTVSLRRKMQTVSGDMRRVEDLLILLAERRGVKLSNKAE